MQESTCITNPLPDTTALEWLCNKSYFLCRLWTDRIQAVPAAQYN
jgi:hypothetical protein